MAINRTKVLANAQKHVRKSNWDKALREYLTLVDDDPSDVRNLLKCADLYVKLNQITQALDAYRAVAAHYAREDIYEKALAVYKQALRIDPEQVEIHQAIGEAYHRLGRLKDAVRAYHQAQRIYKDRGDDARQREVLEYMLHLDPQDMGLRIQLAERYAKDGLQDEALQLFTESAERFEEEGRLDEFVQVSERIIFLDPNRFELRKKVVRLYIDRNDHKHALKHLQACFKAFPHEVETLELLGQTFERLDHGPKAVLVYTELVQLFKAQHRPERVQDVYRKILRLEPDHAQAKKALGRVQENLDDSGMLAGLQDTGSIPSRASTPADGVGDALADVEFLDDDLELVPEHVGAPQARHLPEETQADLPVHDLGDIDVDFLTQSLDEPKRAATPRDADVPDGLKEAELVDLSDEIEFIEPIDGDIAELEDLEFIAELEPEPLTESDVRQLLTECAVFLKYGLFEKAFNVISDVIAQAPDSIVAHEHMRDLHMATKNPTGIVDELLVLARIVRTTPHRSYEFLLQAMDYAEGDADAARIFDLAEELGVDMSGEPIADLDEVSVVALEAFSMDDDSVESIEFDEIMTLDDSEVDFITDDDLEDDLAPSASSIGEMNEELMFEGEDVVDLDVEELAEITDADFASLDEEPDQATRASFDLSVSGEEADDMFDDLFGEFQQNVENINLGGDDSIGELAEVDFFIQQGLTEEAEEALDAFSKINPRHEGIAKRRAQLNTVRAGLTVEANPFGARSLSQKFNAYADDAPTSASIDLTDFESVMNSNLELGSAYRDMGLYQEAIEEFKQAIDDPDAAVMAHYNIALCHMDLGHLPAARSVLDTLLADAATSGDIRETVTDALREIDRRQAKPA